MVPRHIKEEAHYYLEKVKSESNGMSSNEFLDNLMYLNQSSIKQNKEVFSYLMDKLLDERTYYIGYSRYILMKYANIYGGIIEYGLIPNPKDLSKALNFVLVCLSSRPQSKLFDFGIRSLNRFHNSLKNRGEFFKNVAAIAHFEKFPSNLIASIVEYRECTTERVKEEVTNSQQSPVICTPTTTLDPDTRSVDQVKCDFEKLDRTANGKNRIRSIINNLYVNKIREKSDEIKAIMGEELVQWFAAYLVEYRIQFEFNLHSLYLDLLDQIGNEQLNVLIMETTTKNIRSLLDNNTHNNKALLKNLGHWLGLITLAKNKPLPFDKGYLKSIILKASGVEELMYTVPFVAKVLVSCAKSQTFAPKSPWTLSILKTLADVHKLPNIKLNLMFEVEVLCKSLNIHLERLQN
ncbi:CCR4-NOT transcription complex subunit 1-like isoform X2 [Sipha flava]|nr:CCR4-NOT transcription complex subunit 1-like isoform X2 [Sipha flava]